MSEPILSAIRDTLRAELSSVSNRNSREALQRHSVRLLQAIHADLEPWWHDFHYNFKGAETKPELLSTFHTALERILALSPEDRALIGTLDLQAMARAALRLGAWRLLHILLGTLLHSLRSDCPTPLRLSRATGLVAEWALAAGSPQVAIIYCHESLSWGSETHRIRSYLAYAKTLDSPEAHTPRGDLDLLLSLEATRCQTELADRVSFGELHAFRIECLRQSASSNPIIPALSAVLTHPPAQIPIVRVLAQIAASAMAMRSASAASLPDTADFLPAIISSGRWRDRILLSLSCPEHGCPELPPTEKEQAFINALDAFVDHFDFPPAGLVDSSLITLLPDTIEEPDTNRALQRLLCCI